MSDIFNPGGHLTDEGISALIDGKPDEAARLEAAEHLAYCDKCILRYTALLAKTELLSPPEPMERRVTQMIRRRAQKELLRKYVTMIAAASVAIAFLITGAYRIHIPETDGRVLGRITDTGSRFNEKTVEITGSFSQNIHQFFDMIDSKGDFSNEEK